MGYRGAGRRIPDLRGLPGLSGPRTRVLHVADFLVLGTEPMLNEQLLNE